MYSAVILFCLAVTAGLTRGEPQYGAYPFYGAYHPYQPATLHNPLANPAIHDPVQQRVLWSQLFSVLYVATTVVASSTYNVTCTVSTTACGLGRRRRAVLADIMEHEQFEDISPSEVSEIEPTQLSDDLTRESRAADPQYYLPSVSSYSPFANIDGSIIQHHQYPSTGPKNDFAERQFSALKAGRTVTFTSWVLKVSTISSTPACSTAGPLLQCGAVSG